RWSPDGTKIVFDHLKSDRSDLYVIKAGDIVPRKITDSVGNNTMPFWAPDGEWIYFTSNRSLPNHLNQIWKIRATGGTATQVSNTDDAEKWRPQATVDGKSLYFVRNNQLWQLEISTGREWAIQELANLQFNCNWEASGDGIYYYQNSAVLRSVVYKLEFTTRKVSQISLIDGELASNHPSLSITGKGERFAVSTVYLRLCDINLMHNWK
ncbi:MAG: TolB family protein, partial [Acidobacteriota bacterium]